MMKHCQSSKRTRTTCFSCAGEGQRYTAFNMRAYRERCPTCGGTGEVAGQSRLSMVMKLFCPQTSSACSSHG